MWPRTVIAAIQFKGGTTMLADKRHRLGLRRKKHDDGSDEEERLSQPSSQHSNRSTVLIGSLDDLPDEILVQICHMLPIAALGSLAVTCSRMHTVVRTNDIWKDITTSLFATSPWQDVLPFLYVGFFFVFFIFPVCLTWMILMLSPFWNVSSSSS